jgi:hypothetical protein
VALEKELVWWCLLSIVTISSMEDTGVERAAVFDIEDEDAPRGSTPLMFLSRTIMDSFSES